MAVKYAVQGEAGGSVAMKRAPGSEYKIETFVTPLSTVARETKHMDPSYIADGNNITEAFKQYARPLVGKLPPVGTFDELK